jgi:hypothetical protein
VIDPFDVAEIPRAYDKNVKDSVYTMILSYIENVDEKWGVPGGKYVRFEPLITTMNQSVTYRSREVVPCVRYKLQMNLAPETGEESEVYMLPTKLRVYSISGDKSDEIDLPGKEENGGVTIPATETTTIEVDNFSTTAVGLDLQYQTAVTSREIRYKIFNRVMRIAEMRLTPMTNE